MADALIVPICLDALHLRFNTYVTSPTLDFKQLPFVDPDTGRDVNARYSLLSDLLLSQPFEDQNLLLKAGVHLHWALPDTLTRAEGDTSSLEFPIVPNRWLITRRRTVNGVWNVERQWVVESDFITEDNDNAVTYPYLPDHMPTLDAPTRPFYSVGRQVPLDLWRSSDPLAKYLSKLTVVGHGDPTFAAFYPNCHSIFGFYDGEIEATIPDGLTYDVMGWYSQAKNDFVNRWNEKLIDGEAWRDALKLDLQWDVDLEDNPPERIVCYAQVTFTPHPDTTPLALLRAATESGVSVGNTLTEALAAHLANVLQPDHRDELENLLEGLSLAGDLEQAQVDLHQRFKQGRHEGTFEPVTPGTLWTIRQEYTTQKPTPQQSMAREAIQLPDDLASTLDQLNRVRATYDRAVHDLDDMRDQLFADWQKYLESVYPPETSRESLPNPDEIMHFIRLKGLAPLQRKASSTGKLQTADGTGATLADQIVVLHHQIATALVSFNNQADALAAGVKYTLSMTSPPRFYVPHEPVVLFTGDVATPSDRYGQDHVHHHEGVLQCYNLNLDDEGFTSSVGIGGLREQIVNRFATLNNAPVGVYQWTHNPWEPLLLQWEVEFFPTRFGNNYNPEDSRFQTDFITSNYAFQPHDVDLEVKHGRYVQDKAASTFVGTTILSTAAESVMLERILAYLQKHLLPAYYDEHKIPSDQRQSDDFTTQRGDIFGWYKTKGKDENFRMLIRVAEHLEADKGSNLAQTLSGFNDAMLMHRTMPQLPIADPLGFEVYRAFADEVRASVDVTNMRRSAQALSDFNPIRAGALKLLRLRLVDNFGMTHDINLNNMVTTTPLRVDAYPDWVLMPPRIVQPTRINMRWLAASQGTLETNSIPITSPICGWVLANHLDDSIAIYAGDGHALGAVYALADPQNPAQAEWRPAPGHASIDVSRIENAHLQKLVRWLIDSGSEAVSEFLDHVDEGLEGISPEADDQHRSIALLMGRPLAVVRAVIDLELMGRPAVDQAWNTFRQDMRRSRRSDDAFPLVRFPLRLGDHEQINDGLLGFWEEDTDFQLKGDFSPTYTGANIIQQALADPPHYITMLVDPRGTFHIESGILPTKEITLPPDQYRYALQNIEVTFFSAPILSDSFQLDLPLPTESGYLWSWIRRTQDGWEELSTMPTLRRDDFASEIANGDQIWGQLISAGWLQAFPPPHDDVALVTPIDQRANLPAALQNQLSAITHALDAPTLDPSHTRAHFLSTPTVQEGWLKLRKLPDQSG